MRRGHDGPRNEARATMYARAEFYAWSARRRFTPAEHDRDPITGLSFRTHAVELGRRLEAAADRARAVECYRLAREYPSPLRRLEVALEAIHARRDELVRAGRLEAHHTA